jgi:hypothetical protein
MVIWHLYAFTFASWKIFPIIGGLTEAVQRKNIEIFRNFFEMVNLHEIFYVTKVIGKIHLDVLLIGRIVNFHFHPILEFSDESMLRYWRFKNVDFFWEISQISPEAQKFKFRKLVQIVA